eukprot:6587610-Pyramimonas_sp.AAC.1
MRAIRHHLCAELHIMKVFMEDVSGLFCRGVYQLMITVDSTDQAVHQVPSWWWRLSLRYGSRLALLDCVRVFVP